MCPLSTHRLATFLYGSETVAFDMLVTEKSIVFAIECPVCRKTSRLNDIAHQAVFNFSTRELSVKPYVRCPTPQCGWAVQVKNGIATDMPE